MGIVQLITTYRIEGKVSRFKVSNFCNSAKFANFSLCKMFSPKPDKANFEQKPKI